MSILAGGFVLRDTAGLYDCQNHCGATSYKDSLADIPQDPVLIILAPNVPYYIESISCYM